MLTTELKNKPGEDRVEFQHTIRTASCCQRLWYNTAWPLIDAYYKNNSILSEDMIEDIQDYDGQAEALLLRLQDCIEKEMNLAKERAKRSNTPLNGYVALRNGIWEAMRWQFYKAGLMSLLGECCSIGYTAVLIFMIRFINDDEAEFHMGLIYAGVFSVLMIMSAFFRNRFIYEGYSSSINLRRCFTQAIYAKVEKLSVEALAKTNTAKLITIISGDLQAI